MRTSVVVSHSHLFFNVCVPNPFVYQIHREETVKKRHQRGLYHALLEDIMYTRAHEVINGESMGATLGR